MRAFIVETPFITRAEILAYNYHRYYRNAPPHVELGFEAAALYLRSKDRDTLFDNDIILVWYEGGPGGADIVYAMDGSTDYAGITSDFPISVLAGIIPSGYDEGIGLMGGKMASVTDGAGDGTTYGDYTLSGGAAVVNAGTSSFFPLMTVGWDEAQYFMAPHGTWDVTIAQLLTVFDIVPFIAPIGWETRINGGGIAAPGFKAVESDPHISGVNGMSLWQMTGRRTQAWMPLDHFSGPVADSDIPIRLRTKDAKHIAAQLFHCLTNPHDHSLSQTVLDELAIYGAHHMKSNTMYEMVGNAGNYARLSTGKVFMYVPLSDRRCIERSYRWFPAHQRGDADPAVIGYAPSELFSVPTAPDLGMFTLVQPDDALMKVREDLELRQFFHDGHRLYGHPSSGAPSMIVSRNNVADPAPYVCDRTDGRFAVWDLVHVGGLPDDNISIRPDWVPNPPLAADGVFGYVVGTCRDAPRTIDPSSDLLSNWLTYKRLVKMVPNLVPYVSRIWHLIALTNSLSAIKPEFIGLQPDHMLMENLITAMCASPAVPLNIPTIMFTCSRLLNAFYTDEATALQNKYYTLLVYVMLCSCGRRYTRQDLT